jgi:chromosome partitioning protein
MNLTLSVIGQTGEPGTTTTAVNLAAAFASFGMRVLLVDAHPRADVGPAVRIMPVNSRSVGTALLRQMEGRPPQVEEMVYRHDQVLPADRFKGTLDAFLSTARTARRADSKVAELDYAGTTVLRTVLDRVHNDYDLLVIDTPPPTSALSAVGLAAADLAVAVSRLSRVALPGAVMLKAHIDAMDTRTQGRSRPAFLGTVLNKVPEPSHRTLETEADECQFRKHRLQAFGTRICSDALIAKARELGVPVCAGQLEGEPGSAYRNLAAEIIGRAQCAAA